MNLANKKIREELDNYEKRINISPSLEDLRKLVTDYLFDYIFSNSKLKKEFKRRIVYYIEAEHRDSEYSDFKDFLLFCSEYRSIPEYEDFIKKYRVNYKSVKTDIRAEDYDSERVRNLQARYSMENFLSIKAFSCVIVRSLADFIQNESQIIEVMTYEYNDQDKESEGKLHIGNKKTILFSKTPAAIINFFYRLRENEDCYNIHDFVGSIKLKGLNSGNSFDSNEFRKKIESINERVRKETNNKFRKIIIKSKSKKPKPNCYRWK